MRGWMRNGLGALLLSSAIACSGASAEESAASGADLTQAEATSVLSSLIAHPETNLRGVGDAVVTITGKSDTWTLYSFQQKTNAATAKNVADDTASTFLVLGSSGAIFLVDVSTGACAGAAPSGVDIGAAGLRLHADVLAKDTSSTQMLKVAAFPGSALFEVAAGKLVDVVGAAASKIAESGIGERVAGTTKELAAKVVGYFTSTAETKAVDTTTAAATEVATKAAVKTTESGPSAVAKAVVKLGDATDGKVEVKVAKVAPGTALIVAPPSELAVLTSKTSGAVAVTVDDGVKLIEGRSDSVWTPETDITDMVGLWQHPDTGATFLVDPSFTSAELKAIQDNGFQEIWMLPSAAIDAISKNTSQLAIGSGDAIVAAHSDGAERALSQSASNIILRNWDASVLTMSDADFMKTPAFKAMDAIASRAITSVKNLPLVTLLGDGATKVPASLLDKTIARAIELLGNMGIKASGSTVKSVMTGYVPDSDAGSSATIPVTDAGSGSVTTSVALPSGDESGSATPAAEEDATTPLAHKASAGGCSSAPGSTGGDVGALALGLAVVLVARRRRAASAS